MIRPGEKGDAPILGPTLMAAVPLILDRIYKGIQVKTVCSCEIVFALHFYLVFCQTKIADKGEFSKLLVGYCVGYRRWWVEHGWGTPIMDRSVLDLLWLLIC